MAAPTEPQDGPVSPNNTSSKTYAGIKRKYNAAESKYYAVRVGKNPGVYSTWGDCKQQVYHHKGSIYKSFSTYEDADAFVKNGLSGSRFQKFYAVRNGRVPGVYPDWPAASAQITGWKKPNYRAFSTRAEAEAYIRGEDVPNGEPVEKSKATSARNQKTGSASTIDHSIEPGTGPMPPVSEDGFDARIKMNELTGKLEYKDEQQANALKMQPAGLKKGALITIYTDGSTLGNGKQGAVAGVGVYFGPKDTRNVSEPLGGPRQTNQRAELTAIQRAVELAPRDHDIKICSDSQYGIKCCTEWFQSWRNNGWKTATGKAVENRDLIENILNKIDQRHMLKVKTTFEWVKGHANDVGNVEADTLAVKGARDAQAGGP